MPTPADAPPADAPDGAVADAKAYLRIDGGEEDALLATLAAVAIELCERFTGLALIAAARDAVLAAAPGAWQRLPATPVNAIVAVAALAPDGGATLLAPGAVALDIDAAGDGWVRVLDSGAATRVQVSYRAGLASGWTTLPPPLRQGVVRLVGHLHAHRDAPDEGTPPAAVAALWRPYRRMRLAGAVA